MPTLRGPNAQPEASPYARHIPALDGVRGLAILGVIGSHFFMGTPNSRITSFFSDALAFGATGVDLFFVLSGFLITGILYDSLGDSHFFRKFYARRALRIFPLYYGVIVVCGVVGIVTHQHFFRELLSLSLYLQNTALLAAPIYLYRDLPLSHFWSLAIEEQFYLVWPVLVFLLRKRTTLLGLAVTSFFVCPVLRLSLVWHGADALSVHVSTLCRADALLAGGALALLLRSEAHDRVLRFAPWLFVIAAVVLLALRGTAGSAFALSHFGKALIPALAQSAYPAGSVGLLALALSPGLIANGFSLAPLRSLGKYSYGLYVLHLILFNFLHESLRNFSLHITQSKGLQVVVIGVTGFAIAFAAAYLSYQLYEKLFLRLKKYFDYRPHPDTVK